MKTKAVFNPLLTDAASEYAVNEAEYASSVLAPIFPVKTQAATFPIFKRENLLNVPILKQRAPGSPYQRADLELGSDTYATKDYGIAIPLDDRQTAIYASAFDAERGAMQTNTRIIMLNKEIRVKNLVTGAGVPTSSPGTKWDQANSDPIGDVNAIKEVIHDNCGLDANIAIIPRDTFNILKEHTKITEKYKYTKGGVVTADILAAIFGVSRIVVAGAAYNTAVEGQAMSIGKVWGKSVVFAYANPTLDLNSPSFARTFAWAGYTGGAGKEIVVKSHRDEDAHSWIHEMMHDVDEKLVAPACGYHLSSVLS